MNTNFFHGTFSEQEIKTRYRDLCKQHHPDLGGNEETMKAISRTDRELVNQIANIWIDSGGDAEGVAWLWPDIRDRVQEMIDERDRLNGREISTDNR